MCIISLPTLSHQNNAVAGTMIAKVMLLNEHIYNNTVRECERVLYSSQNEITQICKRDAVTRRNVHSNRSIQIFIHSERGELRENKRETERLEHET